MEYTILMFSLIGVDSPSGSIVSDPTPGSTAEPMDWSPFVAGLLGFLLAVALIVIVCLAVKNRRLSKGTE